ncbi:TIGR03016 family PEP-CTERM system-associated outer membrane protein [Candidatus Accumulibacter sp. ACC003]|uniref:TIGR03016 family PEP-CTERM system-associated outer membrane protein n=1 Tax=Candidatus Accumulibacter sp. ACC003 TaxID=2823334 RepID=UPI0025BC63F3|nr:TIGR03016 family PEP-CTERM system-associated outer membrane protein [Candidatus Accumulibacter sp. ACC003]
MAMVTATVTAMVLPMALEAIRAAAGGRQALAPSTPDQAAGNGGRKRHPGALRSLSLLGLAVLCVTTPARAEKWQITPTVAVKETLTNNVFLAPSNPTSDSVTGITPAIAIDGTGARAKLRLNYAITEQLYARETSSNNHQNSLNAVGMVEAIEDFLFVDATGRISQQYLSAFGAVSPSDANVSNNRTETSNYSLSPYLKGRIDTWAEYLLRYRATTTSSQSSLASGVNTSEWTGGLKGTTRLSQVTWALDAMDTHSEYSNNLNNRTYNASRYMATVSYRFNPQIQVSLIGGQESNDYVSVSQQSNFTRGGGFDWTPDKRTALHAFAQNRFFGTGYDVNFSHRRPLSQVTFRAKRDVSLQPSGATNTSQGTNYDAFYSIVSAANPGMAPDAIAAQVADILLQSGVPADGTVVNGYLTDRPNLQNLMQLTGALIGVRNTVTFTATRSEQQNLSVVNGLTDNYALPNRVLQRGYGIIWSHKLSGLSSLALSFNQQRSSNFTANSLETETTGGYLLLSTRLGPNTSANIGARRVVSSGVSSYTESALTGAISHRF